MAEFRELDAKQEVERIKKLIDKGLLEEFFGLFHSDDFYKESLKRCLNEIRGRGINMYEPSSRKELITVTALRLRKRQLLSLLIEDGADVNETGEREIEGRTKGNLLSMAMEKEDLGLATCLLDKRANFNQTLSFIYEIKSEPFKLKSFFMAIAAINESLSNITNAEELTRKQINFATILYNFLDEITEGEKPEHQLEANKIIVETCQSCIASLRRGDPPHKRPTGDAISAAASKAQQTTTAWRR